ncbi:hypothetical protein [Flavobacterium sp. HNIBRBA15423]|uniref:hypothetical protein n=1 Tax=Flavobacterium sp. HNIBRBA15423 TaxID=3458683 RepID=UPI004044D1EA
MNLSHLRTGDLIVRAKGIFSTHYMVYIGIQNGQIIVAENQNGFGVRYVILAEALKGNMILRTEKFGGTEFDRQYVVGNINRILGKAYDLIAFNCEHFARMISQGMPKSKQVDTTSNIAILSGLGMMSSKNKTTQNLGLTSLILGIIGKIAQP